jgi:hypothetical protein
VLLKLLVEERQPDLHTGNDRKKCFRSSISVITLALFILAIATLQILSIQISETPQSVYGQTQATVTYNSIGRDMSWTSPSLYNDLKPSTSNVIPMAASISENGNNNTTPFLLPLPSSGQSSHNNSSTLAAGRASNTSPSNNSVVNSNSPQGNNSHKENSSNNNHDGHTSSQTNVVSSNDNHVVNQHKKHTHASTGDPIHRVISQSKKQFIVGDIPFP